MRVACKLYKCAAASLRYSLLLRANEALPGAGTSRAGHWAEGAFGVGAGGGAGAGAGAGLALGGELHPLKKPKLAAAKIDNSEVNTVRSRFEWCFMALPGPWHTL